MEKIKEFLAENYRLQAGKITPLEGYDTVNYKVETGSGDFVLKFYDPHQEKNTEEILKAENLLLQHLTSEDKISFPVPQKDLDGKYLSFSKPQNKFFRLLTFVEGEMFVRVEHTPELFYSFGKFLAQMNKKMLDFRHLSTEARKFKWDLQFYHLTKQYAPFIENPADRKLVEYFFLQTRELVEPRMETLRKSVIHGDANDWNVLVKEGGISGIIDFGDISYTPLINELAIALTYALMGKNDPVEWAPHLIRGYHQELPLEEIEIELLYQLIATRLCLSTCNFANSKRSINYTDYMGVSENATWKLLHTWIRINPLKFEDEIRKALGFETKIVDSTEKDLARRQQHTSKALALQFSRPIKMTRAAFQYMFDADGKTYLDCYNNIPQVGHCHPRVVEAGQRAAARLNTNTRYLNDTYNDYAENLLKKFPENLTKVFFVNSGSAASDLAIRLALAHTKNQGIVVMEHGYHGNTRLGIEISHYKYFGKGGTGKTEPIIEAEIPDTYKGKYTENDGTAGRQYAGELFNKIEENSLSPAAFIAEPIIGCGGQIPLAKDYLEVVYPFIRERGGVCISDEVQTGFGRLGDYFWGFEMHGVIPDIVVIGKPMGNGHPLAAVVTTDSVAASFETGMEFFSSFGGNPVSCAIGQAVLDVLEEEQLPENAGEVGRYLSGLLEDLVEKHESAGDARGMGLFLGLELVRDKRSKEPDGELAAFIQNGLRERGILVGTDGPFENVIKIKPPICFTRENALELAGGIDELLISCNDLK